MDDREKLIKLVEMIVVPYFAEMIADLLIANGVTFAKDTNVPGKWIPASEPPKESGEYNVIIHKGATPTTLMYNATTQEWFETIDYGDGEEGYTYYPVEYWTPLPEPPKEN